MPRAPDPPEAPAPATADARPDGVDRDAIRAGADLTEADLSGRDLAGASLEGARLGGARLSESVLTGAVLARADLSRADLRGADLRGADLSLADLRGANLRGARLDDARAQGARIDGVEAEPAVLDALKRAGARRGGLAGLVSGLVGLVPRRWTNPLSRRNRASGRARAASLGGPGADLRGAALAGLNLSSAAWAGVRLDGVDLTEARLEAADLKGALLEEARLEATDLRNTRLQGARAAKVRLADADLRGADLAEADLTEADLTGADLREANLRGARLTGAVLRSARLADLDLDGVDLDRATLDQADASGVSWAGASVRDADLSGALGLGDEDRAALAARGARFGDEGALVGLSGRLARNLLALAALGMGVYLAARFLAPGAESTQSVTDEAEALRETDPLEASRRYEELAKAAERPEDQVGHRIEAAGLAEKAGDVERARGLLQDALTAAADDTALSGRVRLRLGELLAEAKRWAEVEAVTEPLLALEGQPDLERARGLVLYEDALAAQGRPATRVEEALAALALLPEAQGALLQSMAEIRANRGQDEAALAALDRLASLELPAEAAERALASRARVLDRLDRPAEARAAWEGLARRAAPDSLSHQSALLALADLDRRDGQPDAALKRLAPLLADEADARLHGRALLLRGGIREDRAQANAAIEDYRSVLALGGLDADTVGEARLALARLLLAEGGEADARAVLDDLDPAAATAVLAEARLGEGRRLLDAGETASALAIFDQIIQAGSAQGGVLDPAVLRAARAGRAEALLAAGETQEAIGIWQELLDSALPAAERPGVVLSLASALLARGEGGRAATMFAELAASKDPDTAAQGRIGMAEAARAAGEKERATALLRRVADQAPDPAWRVRALSELAEMALEDRRYDGALEAWRALLAAVPPGHAAALEARLSIVSTLEEAGRPAEAATACASARSATAGSDRATVRLHCGQLAERAGRAAEARADLQAALSEPSASEEQVSEAGLTLARLLQADPAEAAARVDQALARCRKPSTRVPLLAMRAELAEDTGDAAAARAARAELDGLAPQAAEAAAGFYGDAAARARARGDGAEAARLLGAALTLSLPEATRAELMVDLGQALLDQGDLQAGAARLEEAAVLAPPGSATALLAEIGRAEVERRKGDPAAAARRLQQLQPPDDITRQRWLEALGRALGEARDPEAAKTWQALAEGRPEGDETRLLALRGAAEAALAAGDATEALRLFEEATRVSVDPTEQGQASLGAADALARLGRLPEARASLRALASHPDPEVSLSAAIRASNLASDQRDWEAALAVLEDRDGAALGPAWDATLTEARVRALAGAGRRPEAREALEALQTRWPDQEEARLPALLGLAHLAHQEGETSVAKRLAVQARETAVDPGYRAMAEELLRALKP